MILLLSFAFESTGFSQTNGSLVHDLDKFYSHLESNDKFMGSVAISIDCEIRYQGQFGYFDPNDTKKKPDSETQYRIGSISKTFTSVLILQLVEEEKLSLDTKLSKFFPNLKNADKILISHLLRHRSGLGSVTDDPNYRQWNTKLQSRKKMLARIAKQPIKFQPDEKTEYNNSNFLLLGYIIESITGNSYADELKTRISDRIGLKRTEYASKIDTTNNVAASFRWSNGNWKTTSETDPSIPHGAGAIVSTPTDLIIFIESLFAGKLIKKSTLSQMTEMVDGLGMGIIQFPFGKKRALGHNGGIDGFQSSLGHFPNEKSKVTIAVLGNAYNYPMNDILVGTLKFAFVGELELPTFEEVEVAESKLNRYQGVYSTPDIPLKISVNVVDGKLVAQGTGQSALTLSAINDVEFQFEQAGINITFAESNPNDGFDLLVLKQGGVEVTFTKEK